MTIRGACGSLARDVEANMSHPDDLNASAAQLRMLAAQATSSEMAVHFMNMANRCDDEARRQIGRMPPGRPSIARPSVLARLLGWLGRRQERWMQQRLAGRDESRLWLLSRMMLRLGIDPLVAGAHRDGATMTLIRRTCRDCRSTWSCGAWVMSTPDSDDYHRFCPNAARLDLLRMHQGARAAVPGG
jgi:hypothetical protein